MHQLPPNTVRLLSSSQVITSVLNVVKELTENSLDAEATSIDIKLENYGLDRIEVRDNGGGIRAEDAPVMGVRHYTSKICHHDDLETLQTYGFRGEALGSICAVAEVSVTTKTKEDDISTHYTLDFTGNIVSQKPSHLGQGTTVSVQKLFKNLPVRRQYYSNTKKCKEELKKVQDVLMAFAIIKPELRISLYHNKVVIWQKSKMADHRSALVSTLGPNTVANLLPFYHRHEEPEIVLDGFYPKPGADHTVTSSSSPDKTYIYVNNRPVHHKDIIKLIRQQYSAQFSDEARGRFPVFVLKISVSPASVDVNLTPDKTQVLLHHKDAVLTAVEELLASLYGSQPKTDHPKEVRLDTTTELSKPTKDLQAEDTPINRKDTAITSSVNKNILNSNKEIQNQNDASVHCQTSNSSSSSSIAEDWVVNQIPANFSICDEDETSQSCEKETTKNSPEKLENNFDFTEEEWSRGTALKDPVTNKPLQPVAIHQPKSDIFEIKTAHNLSKPISNAITEKRAALTVCDVVVNRVVRAPLSPAALFEKETRSEIVSENPKASLHQINSAVQDRWKSLSQEEKKEYEDRAQKNLELHEKVKSSSEAPRKASSLGQGHKRKAPLSNQQLLDELFSAQPQKKMKSSISKPSRLVQCSMVSLRQHLTHLSAQKHSPPLSIRPLCSLGHQSAWLVLSEHSLMVLNPFRVKEALLFKRLMENNILPTVDLKEPIVLSERILGGPEYMQTLCSMEKHSPDIDGSVLFSDLRLVANGFKIKLHPGTGQKHVEVTAIADCVSFLGVDDLKGVLKAVVQRRARAVQECRPLKITNYLKGEAVRLVRQLPPHFSREEVSESVQRMQQFGLTSCLHGRPLLHLLTDLPQTEQEVQATAKTMDL